MHFVLVPLVVFLTNGIICVISENSSKNYEVTLINGRIVGGRKVQIEDYPYQLSLQLNSYHICGAALIGDKWALTAAHCTYRVPSINFTVRAGTSYRGYEGEVIGIKRIHEHPSYNQETQDSDIAVLELITPVTTKKAAKISMASWYNFLFPWLSGTATGWGTTKENGTAAWQLRAVSVPLVNYYSCVMAYGKYLTSNMFCAGEKDKDSCQGDSGGPFVISGKLYGIVSFGIGCGKPNYPGVYTRVSSFRSFIYRISRI